MNPRNKKSLQNILAREIMLKIPLILFLFSTLLTSPLQGNLFSSTPKEDLDWKTRLEYARVLSYQKKYDESLAEYEKLLQTHPDHAEIKIDMAKVYYYQHQDEKALEIFNQLDSKDLTPELDLLRGDIYLAKKDYSQAEEIYRKNLELLPEKKDEILFKIAELLSWQKKYPESIEIYKQLVDSHPDDIQLKRKYAMVLLWSGNHKEAAELLKQTLN